jgi:Transposase DDE domain
VTNWKEYNQALRDRGNITVWFTEAAIQEWVPEKTGKRGRPFEYSGHAIATAIIDSQSISSALASNRRLSDGYRVHNCNGLKMKTLRLANRGFFGQE